MLKKKKSIGKKKKKKKVLPGKKMSKKGIHFLSVGAKKKNNGSFLFFPGRYLF